MGPAHVGVGDRRVGRNGVAGRLRRTAGTFNEKTGQFVGRLDDRRADPAVAGISRDLACIFDASMDFEKGSGSTAGLLLVRPLSKSKGDDYMAQTSMRVAWPVLPPTQPLNVKAVILNNPVLGVPTTSPDECCVVLVSWNPPALDGGAPIAPNVVANVPSGYTVTAEPMSGSGPSVTCPVVSASTNGAACDRIDPKISYTFTVRVTNTEMLSAASSTTLEDSAGTSTTTSTAPPVPPTTAAVPTTTLPGPTAPPTSAAPPTTLADRRNAAALVEAESFDRQCSGCSGVTVKAADGYASGGYIGAISSGDWVAFDGVSTPAGSDAKVELRFSSGTTGEGTVEVRDSGPDGGVLAVIPVKGTGGWKEWATSAPVMKASTLGVRNIFLVFKSKQSGDFLNVDWFRFTG